MPTYEYECEDCHYTLEAEQSIKDEPLTWCPGCNRGDLKRLISKPNFILKGSVWARDGYHSAIKEELKNLPQSDEDD